MKKLNKKGFTLVELLAVIVILAVVMVITIPTVLGSMNKANKSAFASAVKAVNKYINDQKEMCNANIGELADYNNSVFIDANCTLSDTKFGTIVTAAGYDGKIDVTVGKFELNTDGTIKYAEGIGEFANQTYGTKTPVTP